MSQAMRVGILTPLLVGIVAGCATRRPCPSGHACPVSAEVGAGVEAIAEVTRRRTISPDLADVASYETVRRTIAGTVASSQFQAVDARQCQCLAAANSALANAIESESRLAMSQRGAACAEVQMAEIRAELLALRAVEERNNAAADALELFYRLAEAESNRDLVQRSLEETDRVLSYIEQLKGGGVQTKADQHAARRQKADVLARQTEVRLSIAQLNGQLRHFLGFDSYEPTPIWPEADLKVTVDAVDVDAAIAEGLCRRADLQGFGLLGNTLNQQSLPAVRQGLSLVNVVPGAPPEQSCGLGQICNRRDVFCEVQVRRRQLNELHASREHLAAEEIRQAAAAVEARLQQIALAKEKLDSWLGRIEWLRSKRGTGGVTAFDISEAELRRIESESELIHQVIAWRIAQVKLKKAQGLLAFECGYDAAGRCR